MTDTAGDNLYGGPNDRPVLLSATNEFEFSIRIKKKKSSSNSSAAARFLSIFVVNDVGIENAYLPSV